MDAHLWGHTGTCFLLFSQMWCRFYTACSLVTQRRWLSLVLRSCLYAHTYEKVALKPLEAQEWGWFGHCRRVAHYMVMQQNYFTRNLQLSAYWLDVSPNEAGRSKTDYLKLVDAWSIPLQGETLHRPLEP